MRTFTATPADIKRRWHVIDAAGQPLGRVATVAASLLRGKHKPIFSPHLDTGDFVVIVNAAKVALTGRKAEQKMYYRHSGYPGGLRRTTFEEMMAKRPERVVELAVKGMLPHRPLGRAMFRKLKVYAGPTHPHQSQIVGQTRAEAQPSASEAAAGRTEETPA
ncbi:MAG: 50S ribosomal protein L13 [Chloroflexi bacterium]|nr:50S ribosomal protein L13 [Chloroflexota bacterium]